MATVQYNSLVSVKLQLNVPGHAPSYATGFLYKKNQQVFLVTNWHVLSGRDPRTGQPRNAMAACPDRIAFSFVDRNNPNQSYPVDLPLHDDHGNGLWHQSRKSGQKIDVVTLLLPNELLNLACSIDGDAANNPARDPVLEVSHDVFIVGFPHGIARQGFIPIWKRGTIASEPDMPIAEQKIFLVDASTREGMSGSPVYFASVGGYKTESGAMVLGTERVTKLVGIYAGREGSSQDETIAQLSRVWHVECLTDVLNDHGPGSFEII